MLTEDSEKVIRSSRGEVHEENLIMKKELQEYNKPLLHYIFTLTLSDGSFLDLSSLKGWNKFMEMHIDIFSEYFKCAIYGRDDDPKNIERFILKELGEHSGGMGWLFSI